MDKLSGKPIPVIAALFPFFFLLSLSTAAYSADVNLSWTAPHDNRVTGYNIYYGLSNPAFKNSPAICIKNPNQTEYSISGLQPGHTYYFAATSFDKDDNESDFSRTIRYTVPRAPADDEDAGDSDTEENSASSGTDTSTSPGNPTENTDETTDDSAGALPDGQQDNVVSLAPPDSDSHHSITLASPPGTRLENCRIRNSLPANLPDDTIFEWGLFAFTITGIPEGGATSLTINLPEDARPTDYIKYGPTPAKPYDHWYAFMDNGQTGAAINGSVITLYFVDGAKGDANLVPDGKIIDPGGPFYTTASASSPQAGSDDNDAAAGSSTDNGGSGGGGGSCFITSLNL